MDVKEYKELTKKIIPNGFSFKRLLVSFLIGGLVGLLGQIIVDVLIKVNGFSKNDACNIMMTILILVSSLLTALGIFDHLVVKAGAGLIVPITGFAHSTTSSALEYRKEGIVYGIGANIFKLSGSVIMFGVVSAYLFGLIKYLLMGV